MNLDILVEKLHGIKKDIITEATTAVNNKMFALITNMLKTSGDGKITQKETNVVKKQINLYDDCISFLRCIGTAGVGDEQFTTQGNSKPVGKEGIKAAYKKVMSDFDSVMKQNQGLSKNAYDRNTSIGAINHCYSLFKKININDLSDLDDEDYDAKAEDFPKDKDGHIDPKYLGGSLDKVKDFDEHGKMIKKLPAPFKKTNFRKELVVAVSKLRSSMFQDLLDDVIPGAPKQIIDRFNSLSSKSELTDSEEKEIQDILAKYNGRNQKGIQVANENGYRQTGEGKSEEEVKKDRISTLKGNSASNLKAKREERQLKLKTDAKNGVVNEKKVASGQTTATYGKIVKGLIKKWISENAPVDDNHKVIFYGKIPTGYATAESTSILGTFTFIPDPTSLGGTGKVAEAIKDIKTLTKFNGKYCVRTSKDFAFTSEEMKYVESHASARGNTDSWKTEVQKWLGLKSICTEEISYFNY